MAKFRCHVTGVHTEMHISLLDVIAFVKQIVTTEKNKIKSIVTELTLMQ